MVAAIVGTPGPGSGHDKADSDTRRLVLKSRAEAHSTADRLESRGRRRSGILGVQNGNPGRPGRQSTGGSDPMAGGIAGTDPTGVEIGGQVWIA